MEFCALASGSSGNCFFVKDGKTAIAMKRIFRNPEEFAYLLEGNRVWETLNKLYRW